MATCRSPVWSDTILPQANQLVVEVLEMKEDSYRAVPNPRIINVSGAEIPPLQQNITF